MTTPLNIERYQRQLALPEISIKDQQHFTDTHIAIIGAGGLGSASLPYLAAAGIGKITIFDDDQISRSNLHRQTIYKDQDIGQSKAKNAAAYAAALNPDIQITATQNRLISVQDFNAYNDATLIIDGSDNFATKTLLNDISIAQQIPFITASVNQWAGQIGIFAGYAKDQPCYHCLFPDLPSDAKNCNEAGILGTSAGITGMYQAHIALGFLLGLKDFTPRRVLSFDFKTLRLRSLTISKDKSCKCCKNNNATYTPPNTPPGPPQNKEDTIMPNMISMTELAQQDHIIIDVRTHGEITADPIPSETIHMEVSTVPAKHEELPKDKLLAFVCAGNVRSVQAVEYLEALGYDNICVLDKFSF